MADRGQREYRISKSETNPNFQNPNVQNEIASPPLLSYESKKGVRNDESVTGSEAGD